GIARRRKTRAEGQVMKLSWRVEAIQLAIIAAMFIVAACAWAYVPERIPVHWNVRGEVDGYGNKFMGLVLLPIVVGGMYLLMLLLPMIDPGRRNYANFAKAYSVIRIGFVLFMASLYSVG